MPAVVEASTDGVPMILLTADRPPELRQTGANQTIGVAFATEAGQFQAAGLSAIVCGPGSILQAHQPDEFIELSQMQVGEAFLRRLIAWAQQG